MATIDIATLQADLIQAEGALRAASVPSSPPSDGSMDGSTIFSFGLEMARHLATLTTAIERDGTHQRTPIILATTKSQFQNILITFEITPNGGVR